MDDQLRALERSAEAGDTEALTKLLHVRCRAGEHVWVDYRGLVYIGKGGFGGFEELFKTFPDQQGFSVTREICLYCPAARHQFKTLHGSGPVLLELVV